MEEAKLRRIQLILATLGALIGIIVGGYNLRKMMTPEPPPPPPPIAQRAPGGELTSALEEAGASWIRKVAKPKED